MEKRREIGKVKKKNKIKIYAHIGHIAKICENRENVMKYVWKLRENYESSFKFRMRKHLAVNIIKLSTSSRRKTENPYVLPTRVFMF
jgi:hypothetical protein